jgi:hypothetical protein
MQEGNTLKAIKLTSCRHVWKNIKE